MRRAPLALHVLVTWQAVSSLSFAGDPLILYSNDFEAGVGPEWSIARADTSPVLDRRFLGQFQTGTSA
jgi:hypothetical protein